MSIVIKIKPEIEKELSRRAEALGISLDEYIASVLEQATSMKPNRAENQTIEEFERSLDRIAQFSNKIPVLRDNALSRDGIYQDHD
jgi:hypothetical protein